MGNSETFSYNDVACNKDASVVDNQESGTDLCFRAYINSPASTYMKAVY